MSATGVPDLPPPVRVPASTYRIQFSRSFTFAEAEALVPYLDALGVTDLYASPLLQARRGSSHGYDVCDPTRLSAELGGDEEFARLHRALAAHGMGLMLDIVPNHMSTDPRDNAWWRSLLLDGRSSSHAQVFDVDWDRPEYEGRVMVPVIDGPLETALARRELTAVFEEDAYWLAYGDRRVPIDPSDAGLDPSDVRGTLAALNDAPDGSAPSATLRALLQAAPFALTNWRAASRVLNYRRFFDVTDLVGVRVERPDVFDAVHRLVLRLVDTGAVTGLRVDHPDGLWDPGDYVHRLQQRATAARSAPVHILLEKILSPGERLPRDWRGAVHGTTGYNFLNDVNGVFVDPSAGPAFRTLHARLTGRKAPFADTLYEAKQLVLDEILGGELARLSRCVARVVPEWTVETARGVVRELVACFPVYRTYVTPDGAADSDTRTVETAVAEATRRRPVDASRFTLLGGVLTSPSGWSDPDRYECVGRFQQLTGATQAKGLEDTACYRDVTLLSLNEVGGAPWQFGRRVDTFHQENAGRRQDWPLEMLTTSTHDTKRGEDARARLNVLSEMPDDWERAVDQWFRLNTPARRFVAGAPAPGPGAEYLYYQTLVASWPAGPPTAVVPEAAPPELVGRMVGYMEKATREAKEQTGWLRPNQAYERGVREFVHDTLGGPAAGPFLAAFSPFQRRVARVGVVNSLSQLVLKLTAPGIPDIYQGTELWDLNLVDPDNRRPVDYEERRSVLRDLGPWLETFPLGAALEDAAAGFLARAWDGAIKLFLTARILRWRRSERDLMTWGDYTPLDGSGSRAEHVVAFRRRHAHTSVVVAVPRLSHALTDDDHPYPLGPGVWGDTAIELPAEAEDAPFVDVLTGVRVPTRTRRGRAVLRPGDLFRTLPVAMLIPD